MKKALSLALVFTLVLTLFSGCCLSHDWQDAACETPKTCAKCQKTEGEPLGHTWQDATCETPKTCTACGKTEGDALGHQIRWYDNDRENMDGICTVCSESFREALDWSRRGPCAVVGEWTCVDHPEITVTVEEGGTAQLVIDGQSFALTWEYDCVEKSLFGDQVIFWFDTPYGREKAVLATIIENMFIMSIYTQPFTFSR